MIEEDHVDHISQIIEKSKAFCELNPYPTKTTLLETLLSKGVKEEVLLENINSSYPIIHHSVLHLIKNFITLKTVMEARLRRKSIRVWVYLISSTDYSVMSENLGNH